MYLRMLNVWAELYAETMYGLEKIWVEEKNWAELCGPKKTEKIVWPAIIKKMKIK